MDLAIDMFYTLCNGIAASLSLAGSSYAIVPLPNAAQPPTIDTNLTGVGHRHGTCKSPYRPIIEM
jgi:hypothetical protein